MKYYEKMLTTGCFTLQDVVKLTGNAETAQTVCKTYIQKGYIERVKRDLYVAISLETRQPVANRYAIASHISNDAVVSYHSALEYYGFANQVFYDVHVTSSSRFTDFFYNGIQYHRNMPYIQDGITETNGVRVTTAERTVIDCIHQIDKAGGLEELLRCISLIPMLQEAPLLSCLSEYSNGFLYQKSGCILSSFADDLGLSNAFFEECKQHLPKGKSYLDADAQNLAFYPEWRLYAPADFSQYTDKGVKDYDAI